MTTLYWFSLIVGGGMLVVSLLGDLFSGHVDHGDAHISSDVHASKILSLRNIVYFLFAFGATGLLLQWIGPVNVVITAVASLAAGAGAMTVSALLFEYVRRTQSGERTTEESFIGCTGRVTLPFGQTHAGRVVVRRGHREYELRAQPFEPTSPVPVVGTTIMVVEMEGGTALVAPFEETRRVFDTGA